MIKKSLFIILISLGLVSQTNAFSCPTYDEMDASDEEIAERLIKYHQSRKHKIFIVGKLHIPKRGRVQGRPSAKKLNDLIKFRIENSYQGTHGLIIEEAYQIIGHSFDQNGIHKPLNTNIHHFGDCTTENSKGCIDYLPYNIKFISTERSLDRHYDFLNTNECGSYLFSPSEQLIKLIKDKM